jgi:hypothetical protein
MRNRGTVRFSFSWKTLLQVFWGKTCCFGKPSQHSGTDFFAVMERKDDIRPPGSLKHTVRTSRLFDLPADAEKCGENAGRLS